MEPQTAGKRHGASVKTLKRVLKKAGLKVSGKKAALTRRAKKAGLKMRGGEEAPAMGGKRAGKKGGDDVMGGEDAPMGGDDVMGGEDVAMGGKRRRSRRNGLVPGVYRGVRGVTRSTLRSVGSVGRSVFGRARGGAGEMY
jgi:hypothetical protein